MSQIIAGVYEIHKQIGAGGGGIVYLGRHMRLEKSVVLKADKRKLSANTESLRREVDMLKNLSHSYIPQVYDFVQEDDSVYTVMDHIEGESFDKILAAGKKIQQADVVKWACQLLEALSYLHNQPPYGILHGDIKPANIMLRPDGNICLIDYNIALALGEEGAVKVGFSRGYASPEHYGADYIKVHRSAGVKRTTSIDRKKDIADDPDKTLLLNPAQKSDREENGSLAKDRINRSFGNTKTEGRQEVTLDVRSDIYGLGATLYHILSGRRPAQDAREVVPLGEEVCSPAVSDIIRKSMAVQPDMRYQSAEEMLGAFLGLFTNDVRIVRHKRRIIASAVILGTLFLAGGAGTFVGQSQLRQQQKALALSEYSANALAEGDVTTAVSLALQAVPENSSPLNAPVTPQAQKALTDALGVYDLSDGFKPLDTFELPSAPFDVKIWPDGTYLAAVYAYEVVIYNLAEKQKTALLPVQESALSDIEFASESVIVYAGAQGVSAYDLTQAKVIWSADAATALALSGDGRKVAAIHKKNDYAVIYQTSNGDRVTECAFNGRHLSVPENDIFADANDSIFALNQDGSMLAVSFQDGGLTLFDTEDSGESLIVYESSDYLHFEGGFSGDYFAYGASKGGKSLFGIINVKDAVSIGGYDSSSPFLVQASRQGIYLANGNLLVSFDPETLTEKELAYTDYVNITGFSVGKDYVLVSTDDNCASFYDRGANLMSTESCAENCDFVALSDRYGVLANRNEPSLRVLELEDQEDALLLAYDAGYEHDEARISLDGQTAMLFNYRQFAIYDKAGRCVTETKLPDAERIYDQQFVRDTKDSFLEVTWYDGTVRCYSARDGEIVSERKEEAPARDLYEEFYTEQYKIVSHLHSPAEVYDRKTDKLITILEKDSYLTYVTQIEEYLITEYVSAARKRYGLLLNQNFQILAYLPGLCDITEDQYLVFDYDSGNLRQCPLYSIEELVDMGEAYQDLL